MNLSANQTYEKVLLDKQDPQFAKWQYKFVFGLQKNTKNK